MAPGKYSPYYFYIKTYYGQKIGVYYWPEDCVIKDLRIEPFGGWKEVTIYGKFKEYDEFKSGFTRFTEIEIENSILATKIVVWY